MILSYLKNQLQTRANQNELDTDSMIRVNHAGEYGATRIYAGQLFVLGHDATIAHMAEQEKQHLDAFQTMLIERRVRPSLLQPLWHVGGFLMGAVTAAMGRNVAHACTSAVETVIDEHYQGQLRDLDGQTDQPLTDLIATCHADECAHKETANHEAGEQLAATYPITTHIIETITRTAVRVAKRV